MKTTMKLLAFLCLFIPILYISWKKWLLTIPQQLPQKSSVSLSGTLSSGSYYEVSIPPTKEDKYLWADYRIWIPKNLSTIRGLIVKLHGCGDPAAATGLEHANDLQWQALALKHQFALLGSKLPTGNQPCENWSLIDRGSEASFLKALNALAQKSGHPELDKVPWVLWGHSGGADWAIQMLQQHSERIIALVAMRGGAVVVSDKSKFLNSKLDLALLGVPVLWTLGEKDPYTDECLNLPKQIFSRYRKAGALWTLAVESKADHGAHKTRQLAIPYLDKIIAQRLTPGSSKILPIDTKQGWLGNTVTHEVAKVNQYQGNPLEAAWLPNEVTALKWREYVTKGKISPTSKPNAPTNVSITKTSSKETIITWDFTPDLENGLPSFRIYRNNSLIQTFQGQSHNFGDAPEPIQPALEFQDTKATPNSIYTVAAFNQLGESISQPTELIVNR